MVTATAAYNGHKIHFEEGCWRFADTKESVGGYSSDRVCTKCNRKETPEGHDPCLGTLPEDVVMNACCGHGHFGWNQAYVQYLDGSCVRGLKAVLEQHRLKKLRDYKESNL